jgi:hypothetical protein
MSLRKLKRSRKKRLTQWIRGPGKPNRVARYLDPVVLKPAEFSKFKANKLPPRETGSFLVTNSYFGAQFLHNCAKLTSFFKRLFLGSVKGYSRTVLLALLRSFDSFMQLNKVDKGGSRNYERTRTYLYVLRRKFLESSKFDMEARYLCSLLGQGIKLPDENVYPLMERRTFKSWKWWRYSV